MWGSPPPMRGKVTGKEVWKNGVRITPAYAGKSPHTIPADRLSVGSPPPMRGKAFQKQIPVHDTGITPAYAGKSDVIAATFGTIQDHPRLCGEKFDMMKATGKVKGSPIMWLGSPPPMRGKAGIDYTSSYPAGITPAYAGKSINSE